MRACNGLLLTECKGLLLGCRGVALMESTGLEWWAGLEPAAGLRNDQVDRLPGKIILKNYI